MSEQTLTRPAGYTRRFESEDVLVQKLLARGLEVDNEESLRKVLRIVGYYRFTGYLFPFRQSGSDDYAQGTTFDKIWRLYTFDRRLRLLTIDAIARIEVAVRTKIMDCHCAKFNGDPFAYCNPNYLPGLKGNIFDKFEKSIDKAVLQAKESNNPSIIHHFSCYGISKPPVWMLVENLSFGDILWYYRGVPPDVQQQIANAFSAWPRLFSGWLDLLRRVRNICAHHGRLWNRKINYMMTYSFSKSVNLSDLYACLSTQSKYRHTTIFTVMSLCNFILSKIRPESQWKERVKSLLREYPDISVADMGFPSDWENIQLWK